MNLADELTQLLYNYQKTDTELVDWRFDLVNTRGLEIGLKNNRIGGPYSAPSYKRSISGELFLIWKNDHYSSAKLDSQAVASFSEYMTNWKAVAFHDPEGVGIFSPEKLPFLELADSKIETIIEEDIEQPFRLLEQGLNRLTEAGFSKIDGKIRCFQGQRFLRNSNGFELIYQQTPVDFYFEVNNSYGEGYQEKRWPCNDEIDKIIGNTERIGKMLEVEAKHSLSGKILLLFPPDILESFLSHFLIANLYGSLVVNRQSSFSLEDFKGNKQVLRPDLTLEINTLIPYRAFSYPCTSEGVPGGKIELIKDGRLQTPIFSLKYAKKAQMSPTPVTAGGRGFFIKSQKAITSWDELIQQSEHALIVYSVLGLHTQDSSSGYFSLTADQCLLVENGSIVGRTKAVINGDFFGSLSSDSSSFGQFPGEDNPGFAFMASANS